MVLGYFVFEDFVLGYGLAAAAEIAGNAGQAAVGIVGGLALYFALNKVPQIRDFPRLRWRKSRNKSTPYAKQPLPTGSGCFSLYYTTRTRMTSGMQSIFAT